MILISCLKLLILSAVTCNPEYTTVTNGIVACAGNTFGDECLFTCDTGYQLDGTPIVTCESDGNDDDGTGTWDNTEPNCKGTFI